MTMKFDRLIRPANMYAHVGQKRKTSTTPKHTLKPQKIERIKPKQIDIEIGYGEDVIHVILHEPRLFLMSIREFMSVNITFSM